MDTNDDRVVKGFVASLTRVDRARWLVLVSKLIRSMEIAGCDPRAIAIHRSVASKLQQQIAVAS